MADLKISQLTAITTLTPATDVLPVVDVTGTTKKITTNQILGSGGTATLASATITGDLTVDTSTLKVDSANNRVGIGTATPSADAHIRRLLNGSTAELLRLDNAGSGVNTAVQMTFYAAGTNYGNITGGFGGATPILEYNVGSTGYQAWQIASSEQMRLNSTGLGVGAVPANGIKLASFVTTDGAPATSGTTQTSGSLRIGAASTTGAMDMGTAGSYSWIQVLDRGNLATNYNLALNPNGGNVGIGVTPTNKLTIGTGTFNSSTASGSASLYSTVANGLVVLADGLYVATRAGVNRLIVDTSGNIISNVTSTAPSLTDNGFMVFNLTSNTNLRISVRGTDGTTRTANITLA
jgi:hypothetical protein